MRTYFLETERVRFSVWTEGDIPLAAQLWGEEDVTRYICATGRFTKEDIQRRLLVEIDNGQQFGVQYWPIFEKTTDELIGCCGLRPFPAEANSYEIGFHLRKEFWGKGYASEAADAVIQHCFSSLKADKIFAGHHPQNAGSRKLLLRLGFQYIGDNYYEPTGLHHPSYELCNAKIAESLGMEVAIRQLSEFERPLALNLIVTDHLRPEGILEPDTKYWGAFLSNMLIGLIGLECEERSGLLRSALVKKQYRGMGIARRLMDTLLQAARDDGLEAVYLFSTEAGAYWMKQGFVPVDLNEAISKLKDTPQIRLFKKLGWLPTEVAFKMDLVPK